MSSNDGAEHNLEQRSSGLGKGKPVFRLYVSGATPKSTQAVVGVKRALESMCGGDYELRVIDIYWEREKVNSAQVSAVPILVREQPLPVLRIVGDSFSTESIRRKLNAANQREVAGETDGKRNQE